MDRMARLHAEYCDGAASGLDRLVDQLERQSSRSPPAHAPPAHAPPAHAPPAHAHAPRAAAARIGDVADGCMAESLRWSLRTNATAFRRGATRWAQLCLSIARDLAGEDSSGFEAWSACLDRETGCWADGDIEHGGGRGAGGGRPTLSSLWTRAHASTQPFSYQHAFTYQPGHEANLMLLTTHDDGRSSWQFK